MKEKNLHTYKIAVGLIYLVGIYSPSQAQIEPAEWPDPSANHVHPYNTSAMTHGPMLGSPSSNSMRVWIRTSISMKFKVVYDQELPLTEDTNGVWGKTNSSDDNTGYVDIEGLKPNTQYYYSIVLEDKLIDIRKNLDDDFPSFNTLPDSTSFIDSEYNPKSLANFSFGVGFCNRISSYANRYHDPPAFKKMLDNFKNMEFFIMNGDYIYEEHRRGAPRPYSLDLFRKDYQYHMENASSMEKFFRYVPTMFMYDDHETYSDLEGTGEIGLGEGKWLYRDRALKAWYEYAGWANKEEPHNQSILYSNSKLNAGSNILQDESVDFTELNPEAISNIHVGFGEENAGVYAFEGIEDKHTIKVRPRFKASEEAEYSVGSRHYYDWQVSNSHFIMLDIRGERTRYIPEKVDDEDRYLLGETQRKWLKETMENSESEFFFIYTTVSWTMYHTNFHMYASGKSEGTPEIINGRSVKEDGFTGAVKERDELLSFFDDIQKPVLLFTGDLHSAYSIQISDNVWEFMIGPINAANHPLATAGNPPMGGWFESEGLPVKIKWVAGLPNKVGYERTRNNYFGIVNINNLNKAARADGPGLHWLAYDEPTVVVQFWNAYTGKLEYAESISTMDAKKTKNIIKPGMN